VDNDAARSIVRNLARPDCAPMRESIVRKLIYNDGALNADDLPELMKAKFELAQPLRFAALRIRHGELRRCGRRQIMCATGCNGGAPSFLNPDPAPDARSAQGRAAAWRAGLRQEPWRRKPWPAASAFRLIRLDFGSLYDKYQGETEKNLREALVQLRGAFTVCAVDRRNRKRSRQRRR
jgi:hypothetical protein